MNVPAPIFVRPPSPEMMPANVVLVPLLPVVSVAEHVEAARLQRAGVDVGRSRIVRPIKALHDVRPDVDDAPADHAESTGSSCAKIENPPAIERAAVIDCYDDAPTRLQIGNANARSERQSFVRRCKPGAAPGVISGHAEKRPRPGLSRACMHWQRQSESG
jgi:hypothetical protein